MTNEKKELLIKDLCARLPYGVKIAIDGYSEPQRLSGLDVVSHFFGTETTTVSQKIFGRHGEVHIKPYLRPMSSMTEEAEYATDADIVLFDWLNKKMFDYRGLIDKGLALEAPEGMYNVK